MSTLLEELNIALPKALPRSREEIEAELEIIPTEIAEAETRLETQRAFLETDIGGNAKDLVRFAEQELLTLNQRKKALEDKLLQLPSVAISRGNTPSPSPSPKSKKSPKMRKNKEAPKPSGIAVTNLAAPKEPLLDGLLAFDCKIDFGKEKVVRNDTTGTDEFKSTEKPILLDLSSLLMTNLNAIPDYDQNTELKSVSMQWLPSRPSNDEMKRFYSRIVVKPQTFKFHVDYKTFIDPATSESSNLATVVETEFKAWITNALLPYGIFQRIDAGEELSWFPISLNPSKDSQRSSVRYSLKPSLTLKKDYVIKSKVFDEWFGAKTPDSHKSWTLKPEGGLRTYSIERTDFVKNKIRKDMNKVRQWEYNVNETGPNYANKYGMLIQIVEPIDKKWTSENPGHRKISAFFQYSHQNEEPSDISFGKLSIVLQIIMLRFQILDQEFRNRLGLEQVLNLGEIQETLAPLEEVSFEPSE
jgi:hypothetical protein